MKCKKILIVVSLLLFMVSAAFPIFAESAPDKEQLKIAYIRPTNEPYYKFGFDGAEMMAEMMDVELGTMTLFQGVAIIITEGYPITDLGDKFEWIGGATVGKVPFIVILFFAVMIACFFVLKYTRLGRKAYAIGGNEYTTYLAGIRVKIFKTIYYVTCGFLTGLAALVLSSRISSAIPTMGTGFELQSIAAVVIGGTPLTGGRGSV